MLRAAYVIFCRAIQRFQGGYTIMGVFEQARAIRFPICLPSETIRVWENSYIL